MVTDVVLVRFPSPADLATRVAALSACEDLSAFASALKLPPHTLASALSRTRDVHAPTGLLGFFSRLLPHVAARAATLHALFPHGLRALTAPGQVLALTREQGGALLACMFIDAFPGGERTTPPSDPPLRFSYASFRELFSETRSEAQVTMLQLMLHHFERLLLLGAPPRGSLYFRRLAVAPAVAADADAFFRSSAAPLTHVNVRPLPAVIEGATGALQADFANRFIGGGVLHGAAVQEEILFATCPELLVSMLFTAEMGEGDAVWLTGAERFAAHRGYRATLEFVGPFADTTPTLRMRGGGGAGGLDPDTLDVTVVAFDAIFYPRNDSVTSLLTQLHPRALSRELIKALVAFGGGSGGPAPAGDTPELAPHARIATGNWGCGAFNGNLQLKALIQWLAASAAGRDMEYFPFGDRVGAVLEGAIALLQGAPAVSVGAVFVELCAWAERFRSAEPAAQAELVGSLLVDIVRAVAARARGDAEAPR